MDGGSYGQLAYLLLLLMAVGGWVFAEYRNRLGFALRTALAWGMIFLGVMAGYGVWTGMQANRPQQAVMQDGGITIPRSPDGHYYVTLTVGGRPVTFLADTGATSVVLSPDDAQALGIDVAGLRFDRQAQTANGPVRTARVVLEDVTLGPVSDRRITAFVNEAPMNGSLLGMDYLGRFRVEIDGDRMVLLR